MRISTQLLKSRCHECPFDICQHLNLSHLGIGYIEEIEDFTKLQTLNLRGNYIEIVGNLEGCRNLWNLDLGDNLVLDFVFCGEDGYWNVAYRRHIEVTYCPHSNGLEKFISLGSLDLSGNDLTWSELSRLQHMHTLNLHLHNNFQLQKDHNYRLHVVDCLPHVWMLDGRLITSTERLQVSKFFVDSALSKHPVRHKLKPSSQRFTPTILSHREVNGVFGERATHVLRKFPVHGPINRDTDWRRLKYLAYDLEENLLLERKNFKKWPTIVIDHPDFLEKILKFRETNRLLCNMFMILLVASLEFSIPKKLLTDLLNSSMLNDIEKLPVSEIFDLSSEAICSIVSLLLGAAKIDWDAGEDGGLNDQLYLSLSFCISELTQLSHQPDRVSSPQSQLRYSKSLIAAEIIELSCTVPNFYDCIMNYSDVADVVAIATGQIEIADRIKLFNSKLESDGIKELDRHSAIFAELIAAIHVNVLEMQKKHLNRSNQQTPSYSQKKMKNSSLKETNLHTPRAVSSCLSVTSRSSPRSDNRSCKSARLGDRVLLAPQVTGRIISIPQPDIVLLQLPEVPVDTGAMVINSHFLEQHYTYLDMEELTWDQATRYWQPKAEFRNRLTSSLNVDNKSAPTSTKCSAAGTKTTDGAASGLVLSTENLESKDDNFVSVAARLKEACKQLQLLSSVDVMATESNSELKQDETLILETSNSTNVNSGEKSNERARNVQPKSAAVQLLSHRSRSRQSGTENDPTRPNSASSVHDLEGEEFDDASRNRESGGNSPISLPDDDRLDVIHLMERVEDVQDEMDKDDEEKGDIEPMSDIGGKNLNHLTEEIAEEEEVFDEENSSSDTSKQNVSKELVRKVADDDEIQHGDDEFTNADVKDVRLDGGGGSQLETDSAQQGNIVVEPHQADARVKKDGIITDVYEAEFDEDTIPTHDLAVQPHDVGVQPKDIGVQPNDVGVQPHDVKVQPHNIEVQPHDIGVQPNDVGVQPHDVEVQPHDNIAQPNNIKDRDNQATAFENSRHHSIGRELVDDKIEAGNNESQASTNRFKQVRIQQNGNGGISIDDLPGKKSTVGVHFNDRHSELPVHGRKRIVHSANWLAGGQNVHRENIVQRPHHTPGWMEGLTFWPRSRVTTKTQPFYSVKEKHLLGRQLLQSAPSERSAVNQSIPNIVISDLLCITKSIPDDNMRRNVNFQMYPSSWRNTVYISKSAASPRMRKVPAYTEQQMKCDDCIRKESHLAIPSGSCVEKGSRLPIPSPLSGSDENIQHFYQEDDYLFK